MSSTDLRNLKHSCDWMLQGEALLLEASSALLISSFYTNEGSQSLNPSTFDGGETNEKNPFNAFESRTRVYKIHLLPRKCLPYTRMF